ncbi:VOC family protein [Streptomyces sp. NPDC051561]|uniref:VOC family protein n=1 Tax=Streptomyces sp. NPDC051561 TaxID=3365658 RepID=UPI0037B2D87D
MTEGAAHIEIPERYRYGVIPHIMVDDAAAAIDFYQRVFGAREELRIDAPGGGILHAEITIGQSDRTALLKDPSGHMWVFLTHLEEVPEEELLRRLAAAGRP